jgi:hypothetical protein
MTSTWAMKKKANGTFRAKLNARGYKQVDGVHYDSHNISAPVTNNVTVCIVLTLMIMADWTGKTLDVKGTFLHGDFDEGKNVYMGIPEGFEKYYDPMYYVLLLLQMLYGLKQSAMAFWKKLLMAFNSIKFKRSKADICLYFAWTILGLVLWLSWIDDCLVAGQQEAVRKAKKKMTNQFDCDIIGNRDEYVGCKLERNKEQQWIKFTQPVLLQSYTDEFNIPDELQPTTPAEGRQILVPCERANGVREAEQSTYHTGVGKLLHMMRWSRLEILNSVRELSRHMQVAAPVHVKALFRVLKYCSLTPERRLLLKPNRTWNRDPSNKFILTGFSDANYAMDLSN